MRCAISDYLPVERLVLSRRQHLAAREVALEIDCCDQSSGWRKRKIRRIERQYFVRKTQVCVVRDLEFAAGHWYLTKMDLLDGAQQQLARLERDLDKVSRNPNVER